MMRIVAGVLVLALLLGVGAGVFPAPVSAVEPSMFDLINVVEAAELMTQIDAAFPAKPSLATVAAGAGVSVEAAAIVAAISVAVVHAVGDQYMRDTGFKMTQSLLMGIEKHGGSSALSQAASVGVLHSAGWQYYAMLTLYSYLWFYVPGSVEAATYLRSDSPTMPADPWRGWGVAALSMGPVYWSGSAFVIQPEFADVAQQQVFKWLAAQAVGQASPLALMGNGVTYVSPSSSLAYVEADGIVRADNGQVFPSTGRSRLTIGTYPSPYWTAGSAFVTVAQAQAIVSAIEGNTSGGTPSRSVQVSPQAARELLPNVIRVPDGVANGSTAVADGPTPRYVGEGAIPDTVPSPSLPNSSAAPDTQMGVGTVSNFFADLGQALYMSFVPNPQAVEQASKVGVGTLTEVATQRWPFAMGPVLRSWDATLSAGAPVPLIFDFYAWKSPDLLVHIDLAEVFAPLAHLRGWLAAFVYIGLAIGLISMFQPRVHA